MTRPRWTVGLRRGALLVWALAATAFASPIERDAGDGLRYFRAHVLPADLPSAAAVGKHPCILDLRYATADSESAGVLAAWLRLNTSTRTPVFVLVNAATSPALLGPLADRNEIPGLLTIGNHGQKHAVDIAVNQPPAEERRMYEALEHGVSVATLTTDNPDKQRNDEASLSHDRAPEAGSDAGDDDTGDDTAPSAPTHPKSAPVDAALQRAVDVYRGLRAMKKIP